MTRAVDVRVKADATAVLGRFNRGDRDTRSAYQIARKVDALAMLATLLLLEDEIPRHHDRNCWTERTGGTCDCWVSDVLADIAGVFEELERPYS